MAKKDLKKRSTIKNSLKTNFSCPDHENGVIVVKMKQSFTVKPLNNRKLLTLGLNTDDDLSADVAQYLKKSHKKIKIKKNKQRFKNQSLTNSNKFRSRISANQLEARKLKASKIREDVGIGRIYHIQVKENSCKELMNMIQELNEDPEIEYAQPKYIHKRTTFNDPFLNSQGENWQFDYPEMWGLDMIHAKDAWDISQGEGTVVAVIDDGVDYNHPDLWDNIWINPAIVADVDEDGDHDLDDADLNHDKHISNDEIVPYMFGYDFGDDDKDPYSPYGHGTHVAGTIAAIANNNKGIVGVAPKAKLMILKGFKDGKGEQLDIAVEYATNLVINGVVDKLITNNSWGGGGYDQALMDLFKEAYLNSVISVVSAGNEAIDAYDTHPSGYPYVITVGSATVDGRVSNFSNYGYAVDIFAPGGGDKDSSAKNILSTVNLNSTMAKEIPNLVIGKDGSDYAYISIKGTSMASPHVAGAVALLWSKYPNYNIEDIRALLKQNSETLIVDPAHSPITTGIMNIDKALKQAKPEIYAKLFPEYGDNNGNVFGTKEIKGFIGGTNFSHYKLEYLDLKHPDQEHWITINESSIKPGDDNVLANFNFYLLAEDAYNKIKLTVYDNNGSKVEDYTQFYINNHRIIGTSNFQKTFRDSDEFIRLDIRIESSLISGWSLKIFDSKGLDVSSKDFRIVTYNDFSQPNKPLVGFSSLALSDEESKQGAYRWVLQVEENEGPTIDADSVIFVVDKNIHEHWPAYDIDSYYEQSLLSHGVIIANVSANPEDGTSQIIGNTDDAPIVLDGEANEFPLGDLTKEFYADTPVAANFLGDQQKELLGILYKDNAEYLSVYNSSGTILAEHVLETMLNTLVLSDLNLDDKSEAVVIGSSPEASNTDTTQATIYNETGKPIANLIPIVNGTIEGQPTITDLDADSYPDAAFVVSRASQGLILNISNILKSSMQSSQVTMETNLHILVGENKTPYDLVDVSAADLDGDMDKEIIVAYNYWSSESKQKIKIAAYHHDGSLVSGWPKMIEDSATDLTLSTIALGDLDNDGKAEIILGARGENATESSGYLYAINGQGSILPNWPVEYHSTDMDSNNNPGYHGMLVLNVDTDPEKEIIAAKAVTEGMSDKELIVAFNIDASRVNDLVFYSDTALGYANNSLAIGNLDNDSNLEIVYFGNDAPIVYDTKISSTSKIDWGMAAHDAGATRALTLKNTAKPKVADLTSKMLSSYTSDDGKYFVIELQARNDAPLSNSTAYNVVGTLPIPSGLTYMPEASSSYCKQVGNNIACDYFSIQPKTMKRNKIAFKYPAYTSVSYINFDYSVSSLTTVKSQITTDINLENNKSKLSVKILPRVDLALSAKTNKTSYKKGENITIQVKLSNQANLSNATIGDAYQVSLRSYLPEGFAAPDVLNPGCSNILDEDGDPVFVCNLFTLKSGTSKTKSIILTSSTNSDTTQLYMWATFNPSPTVASQERVELEVTNNTSLINLNMLK